MVSSAARARLAVLALTLLSVTGLLTACQSQFGDLRLTIATGSTDGVYYQLGSQLAGVWAGQLGITRPKIMTTEGSLENIQLLDTGRADIGFGDADAITAVPPGQRKLEALARIYDDYIQVVVPAGLRIQTLADLAGRTVSVGQPGSQTQLVADRILSLSGARDVKQVQLSLNDSISAMEAGQIDAFIWSGGLPTDSITQLSTVEHVRLLNLGADPSGVLHKMLDQYPVYGTALVPAGTYGSANASVTTLTVPNFLLVTDRMPDDVAEALVKGLFDATGKLVGVNTAALSIDVHSAIYTQPVPLHPGAEAYYRANKF